MFYGITQLASTKLATTGAPNPAYVTVLTFPIPKFQDYTKTFTVESDSLLTQFV
jgi:hypothetical protein